MTVEHVEILVEEPSIEIVLRAVLPHIVGKNVTFDVHPFNGKDDLLAKLPQRLQGYCYWLPDTWRIVVIVDRDGDDCQALKTKLESMARTAGLATKSATRGSGWRVVNRIAVEEIEAWFFGDMDAVRAAYPRVPATTENQRRYRNPDSIAGGTWEALEGMLQRAGYFRGGLRKLECARCIAPHLDVRENRSKSFQVFRDALVAFGREGAL